MSIDKLKTKFFTGAWLTDVKHYFKKINEIIDYLNGEGKSGDGSYKVYTALLNQTSTNAPVAKVLQNTIGTITFAYDGVGSYSIISSDLFTINKTWIYLKENDGAQLLSFSTIVWSGTSYIQIFSFSDYMVTASDGILNNNISIEIRVYN